MSSHHATNNSISIYKIASETPQRAGRIMRWSCGNLWLSRARDHTHDDENRVARHANAIQWMVCFDFSRESQKFAAHVSSYFLSPPRRMLVARKRKKSPSKRRMRVIRLTNSQVVSRQAGRQAGRQISENKIRTVLFSPSCLARFCRLRWNATRWNVLHRFRSDATRQLRVAFQRSLPPRFPERLLLLLMRYDSPCMYLCTSDRSLSNQEMKNNSYFFLLGRKTLESDPRN